MTARSAAVVRVCFVMHLRAERIDDYLRAHEHVWPEMLDALSAAGWRNYSLFLQREDALVVGYLETDDFVRASSDMARRVINTRWQQSMSLYFEIGRPDGELDVLEEYFHLE